MPYIQPCLPDHQTVYQCPSVSKLETADNVLYTPLHGLLRQCCFTAPNTSSANFKELNVLKEIIDVNGEKKRKKNPNHSYCCFQGRFNQARALRRGHGAGPPHFYNLSHQMVSGSIFLIFCICQSFFSDFTSSLTVSLIQKICRELKENFQGDV